MIIWELFALFYYGVPFPNTAYAKLGSGMGTPEMIAQGLCYYIASLNADPLTMMVIACGITIPFIVRHKKLMIVSLGILISLVYIVRIGGCFMVGRHFAAPLLASVIVLSQLMERMNGKKLLMIAGLVLVLGVGSESCPLYTKFYEGRDDKGIGYHNGITNERKYYFQETGLVNFKRGKDCWPGGSRVWQGKVASKDEEKVKIIGSIGLLGFYAGPGVHIIDDNALCDPFLSRLPFYDERGSKIGHFTRRVPRGYEKTIRTGENHIIDSALACYYDRLTFITKGPLFNFDRLWEILKFNFGYYDHLVDNFVYPDVIKIKLAEISRPKEIGTIWNDSTNAIIKYIPLEVDLERVYYSSKMEISHDNNDEYRIVFYSDSVAVGQYSIDKAPVSMEGLYVRLIDLPDEIITAGYDRIRIFAENGDDMYSIGHIKFIEDNN